MVLHQRMPHQMLEWMLPWRHKIKCTDPTPDGPRVFVYRNVTEVAANFISTSLSKCMAAERHLHSSNEQSFIERTIQYIHDRTECFMIIFHVQEFTASRAHNVLDGFICRYAQ